MPEETKQEETLQTVKIKKDSNPGMIILGIFFLCGAIILCFYAGSVALKPEELVGGAAFNYIIAAGRGVLFAIFGVVSAVIGSVFIIKS